MRFELTLLVTILALANLPLLWGKWQEPLVFFPDLIRLGEWWRVLTHPFVHVSWYHLLLDGAAFLMLYAELRCWSIGQRLGAFAASSAGSLAAAMIWPDISLLGFCGLSGVAHGLMGISAVEMIGRGEGWECRAGWCAFGLVTLKAFVEAARQEVAFSFLHFGLMGVPIAVCHAGGLIGGLTFVLLSQRFGRKGLAERPEHTLQSVLIENSE